MAEKVIAGLRATFRTGKTKPLEFREAQLKAFKNLVTENEARLAVALKEDLGKCFAETVIMETDILVNDIQDMLSNIRNWTKPEYVSKTLLYKAMSCYIQKEPYGVVLVIGAWNYPLQVTLLPVIGAIACGNCVAIKPSELAPKSAEIIAELIPKYLDNDCFKVILGGVPETTDLLNQKLDFICYTGGSTVAKIIMEKASKNLTPCLLELGGKSPVYLDSSANLTIAANRIVWGKFANAGQTCVAPDYILCEKSLVEPFVAKLKESITSFYGEDPSKSADYGRIINERHFDRLDKLLSEEGVEVLFGGQKEREKKYMGPTIVKITSPEKLIMKEEIFGPLLPIFEVDSLDSALEFINDRPKPLALYVFADNKQVISRVRNATSSGGFVSNDCVLHGGLPTLPFGGIGDSGMGNYHGKFSIDTFSHKKACMEVPTSMVEGGNHKLRYPPYTDSKLSWARYVISGKGSLCNLL